MGEAGANRLLTGRLQVIAAALLFSTGGAAIKAASFTNWQVAAYRSGLAAVFLTLVARGAQPQRQWRVWTLYGAYAGTLICFVTANKLTTAANAIFLQSTAPLYLLVLGPLLLHEAIRPADFAVLLLMAAAMILFFAGSPAPAATAPDPFTGNIVAAASGAFWAIVLAGLRYIETRTGGRAGLHTVIFGNLLAFLLCLPLALPGESGRLLDWLIVAYLGFIQIGLAYIFLTRAMRRVPAMQASLLLLVEPALNPVWAWIVHNENPGSWAIAGGALVITATAAMIRSQT
jgi:drug/metabolite transporter (DMT)-like permease